MKPAGSNYVVQKAMLTITFPDYAAVMCGLLAPTRIKQKYTAINFFSKMVLLAMKMIECKIP